MCIHIPDYGKWCSSHSDLAHTQNAVVSPAPQPGVLAKVIVAIPAKSNEWVGVISLQHTAHQVARIRANCERKLIIKRCGEFCAFVIDLEMMVIVAIAVINSRVFG